MDDTDNCDDSHNGIYKDGKHGFSTNISKLAALMMFSQVLSSGLSWSLRIWLTVLDVMLAITSDP